MQNFRTMIAAAFFAVGSFAGVSRAQAHPQAREILKRVAEVYGPVHAYQADCTTRVNRNAPEHKSEEAAHFSLSVEHPGRVRIESLTPQGPMLAISNGQASWLLAPKLREYASFVRLPGTPGPATGEELLSLAFEAAANLLDYRRIADGLKGADLLPDARVTVHGRPVECYVLELVYESVMRNPRGVPLSEAVEAWSRSRTLWLDKSDFRIVRERARLNLLALSSTSLSSSAENLELRDIRVADRLPQTLFEFHPTRGMKEVNLPFLLSHLWPSPTQVQVPSQLRQ